MLATDVAARGIDVDNITHVVTNFLTKNYNHRSGRTGRAGKLGTSIVIVTKVNCVRFLLLKESSNKIRRKNSSFRNRNLRNQLLHLANKIKDVEVDHEIDNYFLLTVLEDLSKKSFKMVSVEFNRFIITTRKLEISFLQIR
jgi:ATP-dependent RNA helicase DeaD